MLTDAVNCKSAFIINLELDFEVIPDPEFNSNEVLLRCINYLKKVLHNERMQINGSLDTNALSGALTDLEGVQSIPMFEFFNASKYSGNVYNVEKATKNGILYPSIDPCIFEIKYPNNDIRGRVVKP